MKKYLVVLMALLYLHTSYSTPWKGQWASSFGKMDLIEKETGFKETALVFGNYAKSGFIVGVAIGNDLHGLFFDSKLKKGGSFIFSHNELGSNFKGKWRFDNIDKELKWNGTKAVIQEEVKFKGIDRYRNIEGTWKTNFGELELTQEGAFIEGRYDSKGKLYAVYNQENNTIFGLFTNKDRYGLLKFQLNNERTAFTGLWSWETKAWAKQKWDGKKVLK